MKKIFLILICFGLCFICGCKKKDQIAFVEEKEHVFYLGEDINDIKENIKIKVKDGKEEVEKNLNAEGVMIENFVIDKVGNYSSTIKYNNSKLMFNYKVEIRKWDETSNTSWYKENETIYEIKDARDLAGLAKLVNEGNTFKNKIIKQIYDLDLDNKEWIPIGTEGKGKYEDLTNNFQGEYDGNNKVIKNLKITAKHETLGMHIDDATSYFHAGLFGYAKDAKFKNIIIENVDILNGMGNSYKRSLQGTGALCGYAKDAEVDNVIIKGKIIVKGEYKVGGLIGSVTGASFKATGLKVLGEKDSIIEGTDKDYKETNNFGGIIGFSDAKTIEIISSLTEIDVNGFTSGGIIGNSTGDNTKLENIVVYGNIKNMEGSTTGGLLGSRFGKITLNSCFMVGKVEYNEGANLYADIFVSMYGYNDTVFETKDLYYNKDAITNDKLLNTLKGEALDKTAILTKIPKDLIIDTKLIR